MLIIHPEDPNLQELVNIFGERGNTCRTFARWHQVEPQDIFSAKYIVIDVSLIASIPVYLSEHLSRTSILFTDSKDSTSSFRPEFNGLPIENLIRKKYNRFQIENAIVQGSFANPFEKEDKSKKRLIKLPLKWKITLPYLLLTLALGIFGAFILTRIVFDTIEDRFRNQLLEAGKINQEWMIDKQSTMLETVRYIANIDGIDEVLLQKNKRVLSEYVYPVAVNEEIDTILILDETGNQIIGMEHTPGGKIEDYEFEIQEIDYSGVDVVSKIANRYTDDIGDKHAGILNINGKRYLVIGGPILDDARQLLGIALVGENLGSIIEEMRLSTLTQVSFYAMDGEVIDSSFQNPQPLQMNMVADVLLDESDQSYTRDFSVMEMGYGEVLSPFLLRGREVVGILGNALVKNFFLYSTFVTQLQIIIFIAFAIVLTLVIGLFISKLVSEPLFNLINASKMVANGNYSVSVNTSTGDEIETLASAFNTMVSSVKSSKSEIIDAYDKSLEGWSRALELRDKETDEHSHRTIEISIKIANELGYPDEKIPDLRRGALLHDIGKMGVPDEILLKPGPLSENEWEMMKKHPSFAMDLLRDIPFLQSSFEIPYCHHERWDGSGYPNHLEGEQIPLSARIFAVVDTWEAMSSDRPYRKALDQETIFEYIVTEKGRHFDPAVVDAFLKVMKDEYHTLAV